MGNYTWGLPLIARLHERTYSSQATILFLRMTRRVGWLVMYNVSEAHINLTSVR